MLGKRHVINNYCIAAVPNIGSCSSCHIGYGWNSEPYDFLSQENVDCLVCHDTTGTYSREKLRNPGKRRLKLDKIAKKVGPTSRQTCGNCHFLGGGGKAVKHGDIDPSLVNPNFFVDVHMDADGLDFTCSTCHTTDQHAVEGSRYAPTASDHSEIDVPGRHDGKRSTCRSCHGGMPHTNDKKLNDHTARIACQTCHIPIFSRGDYPSKMWWDWSQAGQLVDGKTYSLKDHDGYEIYNSKKGAFIWQKFVEPEYQWFNGTIHYTMLDDPIEPDAIVPINTFLGSPDDGQSRIWPVKVMRGKQPYDLQRKTLVSPQTAGEEGFWQTLDWDKSISLGMATAGENYSGEFGFVETEMSWFITHMVAPAKEALDCEECHAKNGRLQSISGLYIPARDSNIWLERLGYSLIILTLVGVTGHGAMRFALRRKQPTVSENSITKIYVFNRFERFWHWAQALLITQLLITGFEVHGSYSLLGFESAVSVHIVTAWVLLGLWAFAIFWHFTTGEWRQYIPTTNKLFAMVRYYLTGIFKGEPHPFKITRLKKHNPLQRLAYLGFKVLLAPAIWVSGLLYFSYSIWPVWGIDWLDLKWVALAHTLAAYMVIVFYIVHLYLITTGHTLLSHLKAMITGWEED